MTEKMHVFLATGLTPEQGTPDVGEHIDPHPMTLNDALDAIRDGVITDAKTIAALLFYARFGEKK